MPRLTAQLGLQHYRTDVEDPCSWATQAPSSYGTAGTTHGGSSRFGLGLFAPWLTPRLVALQLVPRLSACTGLQGSMEDYKIFPLFRNFHAKFSITARTILFCKSGRRVCRPPRLHGAGQGRPWRVGLGDTARPGQALGRMTASIWFCSPVRSATVSHPSSFSSLSPEQGVTTEVSWDYPVSPWIQATSLALLSLHNLG